MDTPSAPGAPGTPTLPPARRTREGLAPRAGPALRAGPRGETAGRPYPRPRNSPAGRLGLWAMGWRCRAAESVPTSDSLSPLGSRLLIPPRGPKTAGAAAPVAAAACSWRARAAAAAAAASTSTAGCLGLPRRECWAPARPPSHPPRREPQQLRRPGPIRPDPRSQDRRTRSFLLRRKIRPDLRPPPPSPQLLAALTALLRKREDAQAKRACVGCVYSIQLSPMGIGIRCGGTEPPREGRGSTVGGWISRKWAGFARRRGFTGKPVWLSEVCTIFGSYLILVCL